MFLFHDKMWNPPEILTIKRWFHKIILFFVCIGLCLIWMEKNDSTDIPPHTHENDLSKTILKRFSNKIPTLKYILLWTRQDYAPFYYLGEGSKAFIENKCPVSNCFVTSRKNYFGGDVRKFDAIAFNGRNIKGFKLSHLPKARSPHQKYIFFNMESSDNEVICSPVFDGFFNWTATYKLKSDIVYAYLLIRNMVGEEVGPQINMTWNISKYEVHDYKKIVRHKSKAVMWLASNCNTRSKREGYISMLDIELQAFHLGVDVYGACGRFRCSNTVECDAILENEYFFYLSFENSFAEDYVTEKVFTALKNGAVPIVYGGANYSRFLPPGSYLDATHYSPSELASVIASIVEDRTAYNGFFRWRNHYSYHKSEAVENVCRVCAALNNKTLLETRGAYKDFRGWWNPDYVKRCE